MIKELSSYTKDFTLNIHISEHVETVPINSLYFINFSGKND